MIIPNSVKIFGSQKKNFPFKTGDHYMIGLKISRKKKIALNQLTFGFFDHFSSKSFLAFSRKSCTEIKFIISTYMVWVVPFFFEFSFAFFKELLDCMKSEKY